MAVICRKCHADCTEAFQASPPGKQFKCVECKGSTFLHQVDDPLVPFELTPHDRKLLKRLTIQQE